MTLRKEFFFSIVASVAVLSSASYGGDGRGIAEIDFAQVETLARAELRGTKTPGAVIGVIQKDRLILAKGVGVANVESGAPVTADMLFHIGSVTKMLTAAAVAILAEEGKVKLNAPIGKYARGLSQKISELTAQELLSQTSGLKDIPGDYGLHDESALADFARSLRDDDLLIDKGRAFSYSNPGYALAGYLIEQVTGKGYADAMNELVFAPLGMARTTLRPLSAITYPLATGHSSADQQAPKVVRPLADDTRLWPAGYIFTNVNDLARFIVAIMNDGRIDGRQVLPANIGATLLSAHAEIPTNLFVNGKYGYGFFVHDFAGRRMCEHGGELPGYSSEVRILPGQHVAVIILNNGDGVRLNKTFTKAFALMLPFLAPETQPIASAEPYAWPMSAAEIASYLGAYANRTRIELQAHDGHLFLKQPETDELPVSKIGTDRFCVAPPHAPRVQEFLIVTGDDGKPAYLQMGLWVYKRL